MVLISLALVALIAWSLRQQQQHGKRQIAELAGILGSLRRISSTLDVGVSASLQGLPERAPPPAPAPAAEVAEAQREDRPSSIDEPTHVLDRSALAAISAEIAPAGPAAEIAPAEPSQKPPPPSIAPVTPTRLSHHGAVGTAALTLPSSSAHTGAR